MRKVLLPEGDSRVREELMAAFVSNEPVTFDGATYYVTEMLDDPAHGTWVYLEQPDDPSSEEADGVPVGSTRGRVG